MYWQIVMHLFTALIDWSRIGRLDEREKDLEILMLRQQLGIAERKLHRPVRASQVERLTLAVLTTKLRSSTNYTAEQLRQSIRIFQPQTVLGWHRQLANRKWTCNRTGRGGRPRNDQELERLVVQMAHENDDFGYDRIQGELKKLGYDISDEGVANILRRHGILLAPERGSSPSWRHLMTHYTDQILACDFFTVHYSGVTPIYVFFFIELGTRRVHIAGSTTNPDSAWVAQQARNMTWNLPDGEKPVRYLIRDRDSKYTNSFYSVFTSEGCKIVLTPPKAPQANSSAEKWILSVRSECLDHILIFTETHLMSVLREYSAYYNCRRPHQGLGQRIPMMPVLPSNDKGLVRCRNVLGGVIRDYYRQAVKPRFSLCGNSCTPQAA